LVASGLWILAALYSVGYMRGNHEKHQTRFAAFYAVAVHAAMAVAWSGNLLVLFVFYEILTFSTYPLVTHKESALARNAGRLYMSILVGTSVVLLLPAVVWVWLSTGTLDFRPGGYLAGQIDPAMAPILLALFAFGVGKAALMPIHRWLPAAMVAPTPVSALLHAVAVVKAGVFTILTVVVYVFGIDFLAETGAADWLVWLSAFTILASSMVAITKDDIKARLAYSTISQLSYIVLGAAIASSIAVQGATLHIVMHAAGKITLFFCAGAIYVQAHLTKISELDGQGREMPWVFAAFFIGALSIIGIPPLGGSWSKFMLMVGAVDSGYLVILGVLGLSSLLNIYYLLEPVSRGFFRPKVKTVEVTSHPLVVIPPVLTAILSLLLFFYVDFFAALAKLMVIS
jgi:multicomponent Na+:H+ antiporter subunit D